MINVIYLSLFLFNSCIGFNFETRLPVIKKGADNTYFGFSVAEHQIRDEPAYTQNFQTNSWILVGAPLDQNKQPMTNHSGALWKCPITTEHSDCEQVTTDGVRANSEGTYYTNVDSVDLVRPADDEIKDNQWLGVTVRSEGKGKRILVCAHRYIKKGKDYRFGRGLCYTLSSDFSKFDKPIDPCQGRPTERAHEQYAYCQAGTSGHLYDGMAVIGSPGTYTWRGTVFAQIVGGEFLFRDKSVYLTPHTDDVSPVDKYSYLGMSVTAGNFFGTGVAIAAGAPRSNGTGQVVIFTKTKGKLVMSTTLVLSGEMITSNFGYELCTSDVNGDGLEDLIVGAPNYFDKDQGGAIYIYINHKSECNLECKPPIKIKGKPESRFGIAIANLGDINKDGYEDIAVGAPYEGNGVVYIYLGSKNGTITEPSQIIPGDQYNVQTFGYSLSGGLDLDNNGYPDLLAGAFESSAVIFLRARPIIEIMTTVQPESALRNIDPTVKECATFQGSNLACFKFEACVTVSGIGSDKVLRTGSNLKLNCTIQADIRRRFPRVFFLDELKTKPHTVHKVINLFKDPNTKEFRTCHENTVFIKEDTKDIQSAIALRLSYSLIQDTPSRMKRGDALTPVDDYPILNMQQADKIFHATFLKNCGNNDICESQLNIDASIDLPKSRTPGGMWDLILGEYEEVILHTTVQNLKESAYESYLIISHSPSLSYVAQQGNTATCTRVNETQVVCGLGNPLESNAAVNVILRFEPLALIDEVSEVHFNLSANTTSTLVESQGDVKLTASIVRKAALKLKGSTRPEEVLYGGTIRGESEMEYKDQPGTRLRHTYEIVNDGPWHVNNLEIHIDWPFQVANNKPQGKWLLYMDEEPTVEAEEGGVCSTSPGQVNPLKLKDRNTLRNQNGNNTRSRFRRKRELEMVVKKDPDNVVRMNCKNKTAFCFRFHCVIYKLLKKQSAVVTVISRLWNSTLVEDYPKVKAVEISSNAKLYVHSPGVVITSKSTDVEAQITTVAKRGFQEQQAAGGIELWMILVSIVVGIILLIIVVLLLWKCGFFKRTRPDPTLSGNLEKHTVDDYHDY